MDRKYVEFDGITLPQYNQNQTHDPVGTRGATLQSIGGHYDWRGTSRGNPIPSDFSVRGSYIGETTYLVDNSGNYLVDDLGNYIIAGEAHLMLHTQIAELRSKVRVRGTLWTERLHDGARQWKTCRLLSVGQSASYDRPMLAAEMDCQFSTTMTYWHASTQTTTSVSATAATATLLTVENVGETVDDAVITVTRTSGTITAFSLTCTELGIGLVWTGSIGSGGVLTIDCGAQTVIKDTTDSYSGFGLSSHTAAGWLPLPVGTHLFYATVLGGNASISIKHYVQTA